MALFRYLGVMSAGLLAAWLLMPGEPPPAPRQPAGILGAPPPLAVAEPRPAQRASAPVQPVATALVATTSGPFAPRPRPPAVVAFGAAAPLAAGQDASAYFWGGVKPDLSD